jgi:uncharacterized membrane protein
LFGVKKIPRSIRAKEAVMYKQKENTMNTNKKERNEVIEIVSIVITFIMAVVLVWASIALTPNQMSAEYDWAIEEASK